MENDTINSVSNEFTTIPFVAILLSYTDTFIRELEEITASADLVHKLHATLLQQLSSAAEVTLQEELDLFKTNGQSDYDDFVSHAKSLLAIKYPVLDKILTTVAANYLTHLQNIFSNFQDDRSIIAETFSIAITPNSIIKDIDTSLGDGHSGESTARVMLSDGTKLIYKPRNIDTSVSYNVFIEWVNQKLNADLKTIKCVNRESYGWLEFVAFDPVTAADELHEYYHKAGMLLAVTLLLGSKDCHYENIIASGKDPVIIDHETIIQPVLSNQSIRTWDEQHKVPMFSVLESMLIVNRDTGVPVEYSGYGINGNIEAMDMEKQVINPNTINSKRDTRFVFRKLAKENIPVFDETHVFASNYGNTLISGFSMAYDMLATSKDELMSDRSPIRFFSNQKIRYVWRPTFIYFRILKFMRGSAFMSSFEAYRHKLYELMSKAYQKENCEAYKFILDCEMNQMLNGDIPFFELSSSDSHFEEDKSFKIFESNCIENINNRIALLADAHKNQQIEYISKWLTA